MGRILLVGVEEESAGALGASDHFEHAASPSDAVARLRPGAPGLDAIVIGLDVAAPIHAAQRLSAADPEVGVLVLCDGARCEALEKAIQLAPLLGEEVRCVSATKRDALADELAGLAERTRARRSHRRTIAALNQRLAADSPEAPGTRAAEYAGQLLDHAPIGIVALDPRGRVIAWNVRADQIFGRSERCMLGAPLDPLFAEHELPRWQAFGARALAPLPGSAPASPAVRAPLRETFAMRGAEGPIVVEITLAGASGRAGSADTLALLADVSAREAASRAKDEFLGVVSHELRTPLTAILGWAHTLSRHPRSPDQVARGLVVIERNALAQARIVDDLLDMSRIISGKLRLDVRCIDLVEVTRRALDALAPTAAAKGVSIELAGEAEVPVLGDADRIQQIVWNLVGNALKFTPSGGRVEIHVGVEADGARLVVRDSGAGIAADLLPFVFDRFRQGDSSITRAHGGLGLGLSIVRHLALLHGGSVRAESAGEAQGAAFTLTLPRLCSAHEAADEAATAAAPAGKRP